MAYSFNMRKIVMLLASATLSIASATNILGSTTSFSKTPLCQQLACKVSGNAQLGPYLFVTYATRDSYSPGSSGYFAFQRSGCTVAVGVFGIGSQDDSSAGKLSEIRDLVKLTGQTLPNLKGLLTTINETPTLVRNRGVTIPLGASSVLSNKSQRFVSDHLRLAPQSSPLRYVDVVYVALNSESNSIASYINRWSPKELAQAKADFMRNIGLQSVFPIILSNGKTFKTGEVGYNDILTTSLVSQGYALNRNTLYTVYPLPGLALSSIEISN